ncbi:MAG TPA: hypothetical protein VGE72_31740 [Azospirillum sp.]
MPVQTFNPTDLPQSTANWAVARRMVGTFAPHAQVSPNMTVAIDPGFLLNGTTLTEVTAQAIGPFTLPAALRVDRVVIDRATGQATILSGTEGALTPPAIPFGKLPVARVLLRNTTAEITNADIYDERALYDVTAPASSPVICVANLNGTDQTGVASSTNVKVNLSNAAINVGSGFDTTNKWFKPTIPGYYVLYGQIGIQLTASVSMSVQLRVNGNLVASSNNQSSTASTSYADTQQIVYLNGTSDYVELYGSQNTGSSGAFLGATNSTFFTAHRIG